MYKEQLRMYIEDGKAYTGMIIYSSFEIYKKVNSKLNKNIIFSNVVEKLSKGEKVEVYKEVEEGRIYIFVAFPLKKKWDKQYMNKALNLCNKLCINGPVVYIQ